MQQLEVGSIVEGKVTGITNFGVFVDLGEGKTGMVHISEVATTYVENIRDFVQDHQQVKVKILNVGDDGKISLSIKRAAEEKRPGRKPPVTPPARPTGGEWTARRTENLSFEDMMSRFKQNSDDKFSDLKKKNSDLKRPAKRGPSK